MILKNRVFTITILAILSLSGCGDRAGKITSGTSANNVTPTNPCASLDGDLCDQDNDGLTNIQEINDFKTDPKNPDTDGDGLLDGYDEALVDNTSNPLDPCDPSQSAGYRDYNNSNSIWQSADCDLDGYLNGTEDNISLAPNNYLSDPYDASSACFTFKGKNYCEVYPADGRTWLDRDLGSAKVCSTSTDSSCYGYLYQWGRGTDGHQERNATADDLNPDVFPYNSPIYEISTTGQFDWLSIAGGDESTSGFIVQRQDSWMNPDISICPTNFYVPTYTEIDDLATAENITNADTAFTSALRLPLSGSRSNASDSLSLVGKKGYIWTTDTDFARNTAKAFTYTNIGTLQSEAYRASGYSVRCIKRQ